MEQRRDPFALLLSQSTTITCQNNHRTKPRTILVMRAEVLHARVPASTNGTRPKAGRRATATASGVDTAAASVADCLPLPPAGPDMAATAACTTASSGEPEGTSLAARRTMGGKEEGEEEKEDGARPWYSTNQLHWELVGVMMADDGDPDGPDG